MTIHPDCLRSFAYIDPEAIEHNFDRLKSRIGKGVRSLAVLKANAYGHGAVEVARLLQHKADYFGVATLEEGVELRRAGIKNPILILSNIHPAGYSILLEHSLTATVYEKTEAEALSCLAEKSGKRLKVHLAVDTGMGRIGFAPEPSSVETICAISKLPYLEIEGIFSHYACADCEDVDSAKKQTEIFDSFLLLLEQKGVRFSLRHICNTAASVGFPAKYDMCRFGIGLYGYAPSEFVDVKDLDLRPAMSVYSRVIHCKEAKKGFPIGYGHTYVAPAHRKIATVSIGYADGYNRAFSGKGFVLIRGKRAPVVGRVCMDIIMVDVSEVESVQVGDLVTVLGRDGEEMITAEDLGGMVNSFSYEVLCNFMPRVKRVYDKNAWKEND
ncbi:MAG: alanine racemase [Clostridia bacterium]|nr:alanine racemase [Clostridia bacterium]